MIEKALIIIIFCYATSFGVLGVQYLMADVVGVTLVNWEGVEIRSNLLDIVDEDNINTISANVINVNETQAEEDPITEAAGTLVDLLSLLTGTYIFNFIVLMIPGSEIIVTGLVILYVILLARAIIGYLRGI